MKCVCLNEKVKAQYYDEEHEEWILKETTIEDVLSVCDDYTEIDVPIERGHWIRTGRENIYGGIELVCSECGDHVMVQHIEDELYCRHCGAYMFGVRKEE